MLNSVIIQKGQISGTSFRWTGWIRLHFVSFNKYKKKLFF